MKRILIWFAGFGLLVIMAIIPLNNSNSFFAYRNPVKSDILVIEAWVSPFEMEQAIPLMKSDSVNRIIIVGQLYPDDRDSVLSITKLRFRQPSPEEEENKGGVYLLTNSSVAFDLSGLSPEVNTADSLGIAIRLRGSSAGDYFAHFNVVVNGHCTGGAFACDKDTVYTFISNMPKEGIQSVLVHFGNDLVHQNHDRNLLIISATVNGTEIGANESNTMLLKNEGKYANGFDSQADEKKNYLVHLGIPPEKITVQSFVPVSRNQTLASARAFASYSTLNEVTSLNIVSSGLHSRRTWLTYQKTLGKEIPVGVINFEQSDFRKGSREDNRMKFLSLVDEAFAYFINWVYLVFIID